jgi:hypothetical protein
MLKKMSFRIVIDCFLSIEISHICGDISQKKMARLGGFEPPTCRLGGGCSIQLSYKREDVNFT